MCALLTLALTLTLSSSLTDAQRPETMPIEMQVPEKRPAAAVSKPASIINVAPHHVPVAAEYTKLQAGRGFDSELLVRGDMV
ncbi:hypothetical protein EX30DRAFT_342772 [Ascodesmis nigricans]|uniref:Uncharacterized protein n=1 Tax=Ascodesmis nigricans TaxID=341454 RepID=A0A4S2MP37_9PEZI|nr:hypothetical protein EX30DRAFT_342772 [Ascodesmis nigricans]